jgi:hypothetical protein
MLKLRIITFLPLLILLVDAGVINSQMNTTNNNLSLSLEHSQLSLQAFVADVNQNTYP